MITNGHGLPVVAIDIDGTLGDFHGNFLRFASLYFDRDYTHLLADNVSNPGMPLWAWMGINPRDYRDAKLAYRQGGWKRWMPCYPFAADMTRAIQGQGAQVWICTTRPYLRLDNVDPDTREWLQRNKIRYDAVLFDRVDKKGSKYQELWRQAGNRVASVLDDLPEMITEAKRLGGTPILRDQPYNRHIENVRRAKTLEEAYEEICRDIDAWREEHG